MNQDEGIPSWQETLGSKGLETGRPISSAIEIAAAPEVVWKGLATPGNLKRCHPFCDSTEVESWPGVGSRDSITYYSGRSYQRNFVAWMEGVGYDIELGESPNLTARVLWRIAPQTASSCRFSIEVISYLKADLEDAQKARYLERLFGDHLQHYLDCVVKGVDCLLYTSPSPRDATLSRMPSSA